MSLFNYGVIFDFSKYVDYYDTSRSLANVDHHQLLVHTVRFLTEGVYNKREGSAQLNEMEYFMGKLYDEKVITDELFSQPDRYQKTCGLLFVICESVVHFMVEYGFYDKEPNRQIEPQVIAVNKSHFAIVL